ncbi:MAG: hypothetical protein GY926_14375 [bacterium]|nr:hypothetical protein [bacterium]MCP4966405.1 hypothetical protein [bacterium]
MAKDKDPFDDLFEPFELEDGPPPAGTEPPPPPPQQETSTTASAPVEQAPCPSCGAYNPAYNRHCEQCGARLTKEPLPVAPAPMVRSTPGGRALSVLAAAVLVVALIALIVNVFRGGDDTAATTTVADATTSTIIELAEITPTQVSASDRLSAGFDESNLIDGDLETEWQVNQSTSPLVLEFRFAQPVQIRFIEVFNITDQDRFLRNYRINGYKITTDDLPGVENRNTLKDLAGGGQRIDIASVETTTLTFEILSNYPSQAVGGQPAFEELVLAEVKFWGTPSN